MPHSGCLALHGVNSNLKQTNKQKQFPTPYSLFTIKYFENESCIFPCLFYWIDILLILVNWLTEKMLMIYCFISRSFSSGIMKCYISGTICKIAIFWKSNCYVCRNRRKIATFWNPNCYICENILKIATFLIKVLHSLGNPQICYF